jgi:hypothetical protein
LRFQDRRDGLNVGVRLRAQDGVQDGFQLFHARLER